ncbi:hypothetical protein X975_10672, partial [Stegodyphus mimosarum]
MLLVFYPTRGCLSSEDERLLGWSGDGSTTSMFSPGTRNQECYKQLVLPVENGIGNEYPTIRRSASSPAFFSKPPLTPITEEEPILPPLRVPYENYGAVDPYYAVAGPVVTRGSRIRLRHDTEWSSKGSKGKKTKHPVSLNQCSDEMENVAPSSGERA